MRSLAAFLIVLLVGSVLAPVATAAPAPDRQVTDVTESVPAETAVSTVEAHSTEAPYDDPENDTLGWENGYWYDEPLPEVDPSDGFNETELDKVVARSMARVEKVRQLEFEKTVPVSLISRDTFKERYASESNASDAYRQFDNTKFEALFLINETTDSLAVQNQNTGSSVGGFYSPSQERIVVVSENATSPKMNEVTLSQELFHALQDQVFNLSSLDYSTRDRHNANDGIVEGDGNYVDRLYEQRCEAEWECFEDSANSSGGGELANIGVYFIKFQPYSDGPNFVQEIHREQGWEAVNDLYRNPPASSEQVISPDKYGEDEPTNVTVQDATSGDWQRVRPPGRVNYAEVGQPGIASMLVYPLYHSSGETQIVNPRTWLNYTASGEISSSDPLNYGFDAAAGWDGDRMHIYRNADNDTAYVWRIVWDSPAEAKEFRGAYEQVLSYWGAESVGPNTYEIADGGFADAIHVIVDGETVTIVNAPTVEELSTVYSRISVQEDSGQTETATATETNGDRTASPTATPGDEMDTAQITETETETTAPGFGAVALLAGLLAAAVVLLVRRH
jgi:hypothetical protein